ncbi:MAG: hypothetical protein WCK25_04075 [Actinomycetes bacterium]
MNIAEIPSGESGETSKEVAPTLSPFTRSRAEMETASWMQQP